MSHGYEIFYHLRNDKPLEYYYDCVGGCNQKRLELGKVAPDGGGLRTFALGRSVPLATSCHTQVLTPKLPPFRSLPCLHLLPRPVLFFSKFSSTKVVCGLVSLFVCVSPPLELCRCGESETFISSEPRTVPGTWETLTFVAQMNARVSEVHRLHCVGGVGALGKTVKNHM